MDLRNVGAFIVRPFARLKETSYVKGRLEAGNHHHGRVELCC